MSASFGQFRKKKTGHSDKYLCSTDKDNLSNVAVQITFLTLAAS